MLTDFLVLLRRSIRARIVEEAARLVRRVEVNVGGQRADERASALAAVVAIVALALWNAGVVAIAHAREGRVARRARHQLVALAALRAQALVPSGVLAARCAERARQLPRTLVVHRVAHLLRVY